MQQRAPTPKPVPTESPAAPWWRSSALGLSLASGLLLWLSFPPFAWWPLAWLAPLPWLMLVRQKDLARSRPYLAIWLGGFAHWLLMLYGISKAHPALIAGW